MSMDQLYLEEAIGRIKALNDDNPHKVGLLKRAEELYEAAAKANPGEAEQLKLELEVFAQTTQAQGVKDKT